MINLQGFLTSVECGIVYEDPNIPTRRLPAQYHRCFPKPLCWIAHSNIDQDVDKSNDSNQADKPPYYDALGNAGVQYSVE